MQSGSPDPRVKQVAAEKLLFLINEQVDGVMESEAAAFAIIELMGSTQQISIK